MKKLFANYLNRISCVCLLLVILASFCAPVMQALPLDSDSPLPLSYGKAYTTVLDGCSPVQGYEDDGTMLTDRRFASSDLHKEEAANWIGFSSDGSDFCVTVTLDLAVQHDDIRNLTVSFIQDTDEGIYFPREVQYAISEDGKNFTYVGSGVLDCDPTADPYCGLSKLKTDSGWCARYIKIEIYAQANQSIFLCETIAEGAAHTTYIRDIAEEGKEYTDGQGVVYTLSDGRAIVTGYRDLGQNVPGGSLLACDADFNQEGTYTLCAGSDNPVAVHAEFVPADNSNFSNLTNDIRYIVIHNTGTVEDSTTADLYHRKLLRGSSDSSWHYTVDNSGTIYHSVPDEYAAWHAGSNENYSSIGIELCVNGAPRRSSGAFIFTGDTYEEWLDSVFLQTIENTAVLVAELLVRYELPLNAVIQHNDCTGKNCPQWLRYDSESGSYKHDGDLWVLLMERVQYYYDQLAGTVRLQMSASDVVLPEFLVFYDGVSFPVTEIADGAFAAKSHILCSVKLSTTIETVSADAFVNSYGLSAVTVAGGNPFFEVIDNCLYSTDGTLLFSPQMHTDYPEPNPNAESGLWIEKSENGEYWLLGLPEGCGIDEIRLLYGATELELYDSKIATGTLILIDQTPMRIIIRGDANGDGEVTAVDYMVAKRLVLGTYVPPAVYSRALMLTDGKTVTARDYMKLKRYILGTYDLPALEKPEA